MKQLNGYQILSEMIDLEPGEKILKRFPFVNVNILENGKSVSRKFLTARFSITNKKLVADNLSIFILYPVPKIGIMKDFSIMQDTSFYYKKVKNAEVPYQYLKKVYYDEETKNLVIETLLPSNVELRIKSLNTKKLSDEVLDILIPIVKKYKHLAVR